MQLSASGSTYTSGRISDMTSRSRLSPIHSTEESRLSPLPSSNHSRSSRGKGRRPYTRAFRYPGQLNERVTSPLPRTPPATPPPRGVSVSPLETELSQLSECQRSVRSTRSASPLDQLIANLPAIEDGNKARRSLSRSRSRNSRSKPRSEDRNKQGGSDRTGGQSVLSMRSRRSTSSRRLRTRGSSLEREIEKTIMGVASIEHKSADESTHSVGDILRDLDDTECSILDSSHLSSVIGTSPVKRGYLPSVISEEQDSASAEEVREPVAASSSSSSNLFSEENRMRYGPDSLSAVVPTTSPEKHVQNVSPDKSIGNPFVVVSKLDAPAPPMWSSSGESNGRTSMGSFQANSVSPTSGWESGSSPRSPSGVARFLQNSPQFYYECPPQTFPGTSVETDGWTSFDDNPFGVVADDETGSEGSPSSILDFVSSRQSTKKHSSSGRLVEI